MAKLITSTDRGLTRYSRTLKRAYFSRSCALTLLEYTMTQDLRVFVGKRLSRE